MIYETARLSKIAAMNMIALERRLIREYITLLETGASRAEAKKRLGIYVMIRDGDLSETCVQRIKEISKEHRIQQHLLLAK